MKILFNAGEGVGNIIDITPALTALHSMEYEVDVLLTPNYPDTVNLLKGWKCIGKVSSSLTDFKLTEYEAVLINPWFKLPQLFAGRPNVIGVPLSALEKISEVEANMELARKLGYRGKTPKLHVQTNKRRDFSMYRGAVGIHNGANPQWGFKRWPWFPELARKFKRVVLVGSEHDRQAGWDERVLNFQGLLSLTETASLIKECGVFITNDSGMMHMASAVGTKTYAIFGPTSQKKNKPPNVTAISKGLPCQPCQHTPMWGACKHIDCLVKLTVEDVYERIKKDHSDLLI